MTPRSLDAFKSPTDRRQYRLVTLANGLEALLIHGEPREAHGATAAEPEGEDETMFQTRHSVSRSGYDTESDSEEGDSDDDDDDEDGDEGEDEDDDDEMDSDEDDDDHGGKKENKGTPLAAACLTVGVGSFEDPEHLRGLAHYLEHMLFMGSEKYPDENEFEAFLSAHGGHSNGTTEGESTEFCFEVAPLHLRQALDMFAQFFVAPLFKADAMDRELRAVESEFNRAKQNDYVRMQQVQCETSAPASRFNTFGWGNAASLRDEPQAQGIDVREAIISFYRTHYSAHRMKLCVYGEESLDDLENYVRESFSGIPTHETATPTPVTQPFGAAAGQDPTLIKIIPVRKMHALHLYWPLPPLLHCYRHKPWDFIAHALGHEADGSLSALLKQRMWATEVSVGVSEDDADEFGSFGTLFEVSISLTDAGLAHWDSVVAFVFAAVRFVERAAPSSKWMYEELRTASAISFQFQDEGQPLARCQRLADLMQERYGVAREDLLRYDVLQGEPDEALTRSLFQYMVPGNTRVILLSQSFQRDASWRSERWLGVPYSMETIPTDTLSQWAMATQQLTLPEPNPFMPQDLSVLAPLKTGPDPRAPPELVYTSAMSKLWYKRDQLFRTPKTTANLLLCLPSLTASVANLMHAKLYLRLCHEALQHVEYQASSVHYAYDLHVRDLDVELTFAGFSDKLPALVDAVVHALLHTRVDASVFNRVRDEMLKEYRNLTLKPSVKARYLRLQLLEQTTFPVEDKLAVLEQATPLAVDEFRSCVLWQCAASIRAMVHGNITQDDAVALVQRVEKSVADQSPLLPLSPRRPQATALPATRNGLLLRDVSDHESEPNSIVEVYYQLGTCDNYEDLAYAELLQHVMAEPLFHELRTTQQLGYEVYCMVRETHGVLGYSVSVQSASHAAGEIAVRMDTFLHHDFRALLNTLGPDQLAPHVASLVRAKTRDDTNQKEESDRYWEEIQSRRLEFRVDDLVVAALAKCSVDGLRERYARWLLAAVEDGEGSVRKLRVHVIGRSSKCVRPIETLVATDKAPLLIGDWKEYKAALSCHALGGSHKAARRRTASGPRCSHRK